MAKNAHKLQQQLDALNRELRGCRNSLTLTRKHVDGKKGEISRLVSGRQPLLNRIRVLNTQIKDVCKEHKALEFLYKFACLRNVEFLVWLKRAAEAEGGDEEKDFRESAAILLEEIRKEDKLRAKTNKAAGISVPGEPADEADRGTDTEAEGEPGPDDDQPCGEAEDESSPSVPD